MQNGGTMDTGYNNYVCTICYDIFLYPVCLPCKHHFCKSCFDKHLESNTMSCPICRYRVSNWLRQLRRSNADVVDKPFWDTVQKLYPEEIMKRINGVIDYQIPSTHDDTPRRSLARQGEIHLEYEQLLQKELEEKRRKDEENFRLSEAMIKMIEEEERQEEETRLQQLLKDEELARRLEVEGMADTDKISDQVVEDGTGTYHCSPSGCGTQSPLSRTTTSLNIPSTSKELPPPLAPCSSTPSTSKENFFTKFFAGTSSPSSSHTSNRKLSQKDSTSADSKTSSISNKELSHFASVQSSSIKNGSKTKKKKEEVPTSSRCSSGCDSIGQELNHFKPIRSSPTTPPKDGSRGLVPKVVIAQRGVVPDLNILPLSPLDLLAANVSLDELETSLNLEKQLEEDRKLAMEIQNELNKEMNTPPKADYNLRKRKRPSGSLKKKALLDRSQTTLDNLLIK